MAQSTRDSCLSLRDHHSQVSSILSEKESFALEAENLSVEVISLQKTNINLKEENNSLHSDLNNLLQLISRARVSGQWEVDDLTFSCVSPEQVFGSILPASSCSRRSSSSLKESQRDYIQQLLEDQRSKDSNSIRSSLSNLHDLDSNSIYGGRGSSDKEMTIMKLRGDLRSLQAAHDQANSHLLERDKQITDLQSELTELHHDLTVSQSEVTSLNQQFQDIRHRSKQNAAEGYQRSELSCLCGESKKENNLKSTSKFPSLTDLDSDIKGSCGVGVEHQLSENIDVLAGRLSELEEECTSLRDQHSTLQATHSLCSATIDTLQDQLRRSQQSGIELRTVLTAEVAERHDQMVALRFQLKDRDQEQHEGQMQIHLKNEVIKDLRKELRDLRERTNGFTSKNSLGTLMEEQNVNMVQKDTRSNFTQTEERVEDVSVNERKTSNKERQTTAVSRIDNELAEKNVLLRELQNHLASTRKELDLKDQTISKLESKLDASRLEGGQRGDRMDYLTGQLTNLQLEVGRTHGQAEHLRRQVENKTEVLKKLENENSSLTQQLNEKSLNIEKIRNNMLTLTTEMEKKKKEVLEQRTTISTLQEALVSSKRTCDDLRFRLNRDPLDLSLVEAGARSDVLQEENRCLTRHISEVLKDGDQQVYEDQGSLETEKIMQNLLRAQKESEHHLKEKQHLKQQLHESETKQQGLISSIQQLQKQVQDLELEITMATECQAEAERKLMQVRQNKHREGRLNDVGTPDSIDQLQGELEETVLALSEAQDEARDNREEILSLRRKMDQLNDSLIYEKDISSTLQEQVENLMKEVSGGEQRVGEQQQEVRRLNRELMQKDRQVSGLQSQLSALKGHLGTTETVLREEQKEVIHMNEQIVTETKLLQEARAKAEMSVNQVERLEEQITLLKRELKDNQEKNAKLQHKIAEMEADRDSEVVAVAERLTVAHEESVHRLENTLISYTRLQAHEEMQVENLEDSVMELAGRLSQSEQVLKESERDRDKLGRSFHQEQIIRQEEAREHQKQLYRLSDEVCILKGRLESVQEEAAMWREQCEVLEERQPGDSPLMYPVIAKAHLQIEALHEEVLHARIDKQAAEEERGHAHEQVLSLIRECNALEEQIHRLTKEKSHAQEVISNRENNLAITRTDIQQTRNELQQNEQDLQILQRDTNSSKGADSNLSTNEPKVGVAQDKKASHPPAHTERMAELRIRISVLRKRLCDAEHRETQLQEQHHFDVLRPSGGNTCITEQLTVAQQEVSETWRQIAERDAQINKAELQITNLQKSLQESQHEVSFLEAHLNEAHLEAQHAEAEGVQLRSHITALTSQIAHNTPINLQHQTLSSSGQRKNQKVMRTETSRVESLETEVSNMKSELSKKDEDIIKVQENERRISAHVESLQQELARVIKARDDALKKVVGLESSLHECQGAVESAAMMEKLWGAQLSSIQDEVNRLVCEANQLKECNAHLHQQVDSAQGEAQQLQSHLQTRETQMREMQDAKEMLATDAQVVVSAVKQWLYEQKTANAKLAGKLHHQNKHILLLNTEKQFLAERNTSMQRINHDLSLQLHDLRAKQGLPPLDSAHEKLSGFGLILGSSRVISPASVGATKLGSGLQSAYCSASLPSMDFSGPSEQHKYEDRLSTCSSGSSSGGSQIPGPDVPGASQLEHLARLADSLLNAARNISRTSNYASHQNLSHLTSASSLGDLTCSSLPSQIRSPLNINQRNSASVGNLNMLSNKRNSSSVGNLSMPSSRELYHPTTSYLTSTSSRKQCASSVKLSAKDDTILSSPIKERRGAAHRLFNSSSIEEAEEEDSVSDMQDGPVFKTLKQERRNLSRFSKK